MTGPGENGAHAPGASQVQHPYRAVVRTLFQLIVGFAAAEPTLVGAAHLPQSAAIAGSLAVSALITRLMAMPAVEAALATWVPWLSAEPAISGRHTE